MSDLEHDLSTPFKSNDTFGLGYMTFYCRCFTTTYGPIQIMYESYAFQIRVTLNFRFQGHSRSNLMVKVDSSFFDFLLVFNVKLWLNSAPLQLVDLLKFASP